MYWLAIILWVIPFSCNLQQIFVGNKPTDSAYTCQIRLRKIYWENGKIQSPAFLPTKKKLGLNNFITQLKTYYKKGFIL